MIRKMLKGSQKRMMMIRKNVERKLGSFLLPPPLPLKSAFGDLMYLPIAKREQLLSQKSYLSKRELLQITTELLQKKCHSLPSFYPNHITSTQECLWGSYVLTNRKKGIAATIVILVILRKGNLLLNKFKNNLPTVYPDYLRAFWYLAHLPKRECRLEHSCLGKKGNCFRSKAFL